MRIAVIGPQNTGKSTFIQDFLEAFPSYTTPHETYRDVIREKGLLINRETSEASQRAIGEFMFNQVQTFTGENVIFDRCVIDNYVYSRAACSRGTISPAFLEEAEACMRNSLPYLNAIILIPTAAGVVFVDDDFRDTDRAFADQVNTLFIDTLLNIKKDIPYPVVTVSGPREVRIEMARQALHLA